MVKIINSEELKKQGMIQTYECWSIKLARFLIMKNHIPIDTKIKEIKKNKKVVYIFILDETLSTSLKQWTNSNPKQNKVKDNE